MARVVGERCEGRAEHAGGVYIPLGGALTASSRDAVNMIGVTCYRVSQSQALISLALMLNEPLFGSRSPCLSLSRESFARLRIC